MANPIETSSRHPSAMTKKTQKSRIRLASKASIAARMKAAATG